MCISSEGKTLAELGNSFQAAFGAQRTLFMEKEELPL